MRCLIAMLLFSAVAGATPQRITIHDKAAISNGQELKPDEWTDNEVQAVSAAVSAVIRSVMTPTEKASSVRGRCTYRGGFCPGALVELKDGKGQPLARQSLASVDGFVFSNLKPGLYNLEVSYPRYNLRPVRKQVSPGNEVMIEMIE